jgi:anti-sigma factor RsiW
LNCKGVIREISNYLDGELEPSARQELERHLNDCDDCRMAVDQTKLTIEVFCNEQPVELPGDVRSRLHEALRRKFNAKAD